MNTAQEVRVFNVLRGEAEQITKTPYGSVGRLFSAEGIEAVWVSKQAEQIDPGWFSQETVDLILVVQGQLKVEFEDGLPDRVLEVGDLLILPAGKRCRAYRWPRDAQEASVFLAVYPPKDAVGSGHA